MGPRRFKVKCLMFQFLLNLFSLFIFLINNGILNTNLALKHLTKSLGLGHEGLDPPLI